MEFVEKFRSLTIMPVLHPAEIKVNDLLQGIKLLFLLKQIAGGLHFPSGWIRNRLY